MHGRLPRAGEPGESIEQGTWTVAHGGTETAVTGPGNTSSETRDVGDGLYTWQPATAAQTALKTLLAGLLDGSITDTVQLTIPGLVENAPTITDFGATAGQGKQQTLTVNRTQLPITITMSATLADTTSWSLMRVTGAGAVEAASSPSPATSMLYPEALTSTFHPPATWSFSQSGFHLTNLPSARHAAPSQSPQRVCTVQRPGQSTTLTLTGTNEAGTATRSVTIQWAGGQ